MAKVRCPCGRQYNVPDAHLGKPVRCGACNRTFVAEAAGEAPSPKKAFRKPIGEIAVERGLVARDKLDACLEYQEAIHKVPMPEDRLLAMLLVQKGLLTKAQYNELMNPSARPAPAKEAEKPPPRQFRRDHPISAEKRETLRQTVEAAARKKEQVERRRQEQREAPPSLVSRIHTVHVALAALLLFAIVAVIALWPAPAPERVLVAYLESADERNVAPDSSLAVRDLGIAVRRFSDVAAQPTRRYDYGSELRTLAEGEAGESWDRFITEADMAEEKARALRLVLPAVPKHMKPKDMSDLRVTVRPVRCMLDFKRRGTGYYMQGPYRFLQVRATSPGWELGWKVAAYEPLPGAAGGAGG